jgi:hypothetical protein
MQGPLEGPSPKRNRSIQELYRFPRFQAATAGAGIANSTNVRLIDTCAASTYPDLGMAAVEAER